MTRGEEGENGYLEINLDKVGEGRKLRMTAVGEDNKNVNWESPTTFKSGE